MRDEVLNQKKEREMMSLMEPSCAAMILRAESVKICATSSECVQVSEGRKIKKIKKQMSVERLEHRRRS